MKESKIILIVFTLIFLGVGSYFVILSQGLTIDFNHWRIVKTGAIFLSIKPNNSELKIDGQLKENSSLPFSFFDKGILIEKLTPTTHFVEISKNGFHSWQKFVPVEPGLVTVFEKIILPPKKIPLTEVYKDKTTNDFWLTAQGIITEPLKGEKIFLTDPGSNLVISQNEKNIYFLSDLSDLTFTINLNKLFNSLKQYQLSLPGVVSIKDLALHPFSDSKLIIRTAAALYELDFKKIKLKLISFLENNTNAAAIGPNEIILADTEGNLFFYNLLLKTKTLKTTNLKNITTIKLDSTAERLGILTNNHELFLYDRSLPNPLKKLSEKVKNFYFSPNNQQIFVITANQTIKIIDLNKNTNWSLTLPKGEIKDLTVLPQNNNYFLFLLNNQLIISEIYAGEPTNWYFLAEEIKKFQLKDNTLYLLKTNGKLFKTKIDKWW